MSSILTNSSQVEVKEYIQSRIPFEYYIQLLDLIREKEDLDNWVIEGCIRIDNLCDYLHLISTLKLSQYDFMALADAIKYCSSSGLEEEGVVVIWYDFQNQKINYLRQSYQEYLDNQLKYTSLLANYEELWTEHKVY